MNMKGAIHMAKLTMATSDEKAKPQNEIVQDIINKLKQKERRLEFLFVSPITPEETNKYHIDPSSLTNYHTTLERLKRLYKQRNTIVMYDKPDMSEYQNENVVILDEEKAKNFSMNQWIELLHTILQNTFIAPNGQKITLKTIIIPTEVLPEIFFEHTWFKNWFCEKEICQILHHSVIRRVLHVDETIKTVTYESPYDDTELRFQLTMVLEQIKKKPQRFAFRHCRSMHGLYRSIAREKMRLIEEFDARMERIVINPVPSVRTPFEADTIIMDYRYAETLSSKDFIYLLASYFDYTGTRKKIITMDTKRKIDQLIPLFLEKCPIDILPIVKEILKHLDMHEYEV